MRKDNWRKKAIKKFNKSIRTINKELLDDPLFRGRFQLFQKGILAYEAFEDRSGGEILFEIGICDKKTGLYATKLYTNYNSDWISLFVNNFIVDESGIWKNIEEVKKDRTIYSKLPLKCLKETVVYTSIGGY